MDTGQDVKKLNLPILFLLHKKLEIVSKESTDLSQSNTTISLTWLGLVGREIEGLG